MTISEVARRVGVQASTIRYYEQIGVLSPAPRINGQRSYDARALHRLSLVLRARQLGFTLDEIRLLFCSVGDSIRASERWRKLSGRKLSELNELIKNLEMMRTLLVRMGDNCRCKTLDECGRRIYENARSSTSGEVLTGSSLSAEVPCAGPKRSVRSRRTLRTEF
jgi:MerR family redox-sensitive transcriptional activator SoxR